MMIAVGVFSSFPSAGQESGLSFAREAEFVSANEIRVQVTITGDQDTISSLKSMGFEEYFPASWSYNGHYEEYYGEAMLKEGADKGVNLNANIAGQLDFYWIQIPVFPVTVVYGLTAASYETGQTISGTLYWFTEFEGDSVTTPDTIIEELEGEGEAPEGEVPAEGEVATGSLRGVIRKEGTLEVLPGVEVLLTPGNYAATSTALGLFIFSEVPVGEYILTATRTGFEKFSTAIAITEGLKVYDVELTPIAAEGEGESEGEEQTGSLSGTVSNKDTGLPLYGAQLLLMPGKYEAVTDRQGNYRFTGLAEGTYLLTASLSGYSNATVGVTLAAGENEQNISLSRSAVEGEGEPEGEGEGEEEGEGEDTADDCGMCCASEKGKAFDWGRYVGDFFLLGMAALALSRLNIR